MACRDGARAGRRLRAAAHAAGFGRVGRVTRPIRPNGEAPIAVHLTVLGSGSGGNATLLANGDARLLVDAGLSCREIERRLALLAVDPASIRAILITHAHGDHVRGAARFSERHGLPVYATPATREVWGARAGRVAAWADLAPDRPLDLCGLRFLPFVVPHDAIETLAFRIETPEGAVGFATDIGTVTPDLARRFGGCVALVVESNHAVELLRVSPYARSVKSRIGGGAGHLSNEALAAFVAAHLDESVRCLVLAHLSRVNNVPEIAELTCREALGRRGRPDVRVVVARQERVAETVDLAALARPETPTVNLTVGQGDLPFISA